MPPTSLFDALAAGYWSGSGMWAALFSFPHAPRLTLHASRLTPHDRWGPPSMPRAKPGTAPPTRRGQHATTCYVFRLRQKFGKPCFRHKLLWIRNLRL